MQSVYISLIKKNLTCKNSSNKFLCKVNVSNGTAISTEIHLQYFIRSLVDMFPLSLVDTDPFPQWRRISWNESGSMLAYSSRYISNCFENSIVNMSLASWCVEGNQGLHCNTRLKQ